MGGPQPWGDGIPGFCSNASLTVQVTKKILLQCCRGSSLVDGSFGGSGIFPLDEQNVLYLASFISESDFILWRIQTNS